MKKIVVKVKKKFLDYETGLTMKPGNTMTITDKRYLEIRRKGDFVEVDKTATAALNKKPSETKVEKPETIEKK